MDNHSQLSTFNPGSLSLSESGTHRTHLKTIKSQKREILSKLKSKNNPKFPKLVNIFEQILPNIVDLINMKTSNNSCKIAQEIFEIVEVIMPLVLNIQDFATYLEYRENEILTFKDDMIEFFTVIISQLHDYINDIIFGYVEQLMIYYFSVLNKSIIALTNFVSLFWTIEKYLDSPIFKNLLKISQICQKPELKEMLVEIKGKFDLILSDEHCDMRPIPLDLGLNLPHLGSSKCKIFAQIRNLVVNKTSYVSPLFLQKPPKSGLFLAYLYNNFEENEFYSNKLKVSEKLQEMFNIIDTYLENHFDNNPQETGDLSLFKEMKLFLNFLVVNGNVGLSELKIESYFNI